MSILVATGAVLLMVIALRLLGRPWGCKCGKHNLWAGLPSKVHNSQHLFGPWTFSHVGHGIAFYSILRAALVTPSASILIATAVVLEAAWEVFENTGPVIQWFRRAGDKDYFGDAIRNSVGDVLACLAGALLTSLFI